MIVNIKDISNKVCKMEMVFLLKKMDINTMDNLKMENLMDTLKYTILLNS